MRKNWFVWCIIGAVLTMAAISAIAYAANNAQNITSTINTARFILFGGSFKITESSNEEGVFKLDTYSGDTWILRVTIENGKRLEKWEPVADSAAPAIRSSSNITIPGNTIIK
jgi:hypothetical protein